jgi:hypothetical protein
MLPIKSALAATAGMFYPGDISNIRPQEGCMTTFYLRRRRGPWKAPQHIVAGRANTWI